MKKIITSMILTFALVWITVIGAPIYAAAPTSGISPLAMDIYTGDFSISEQGEVSVYYYCSGDASTVSVKVTILLEKRTLLLFWKDVVEWTINGSTSVQGVKNYTLTDSGTYRCTIVYEVTSTDGTVETQEYEKQIKYDPA